MKVPRKLAALIAAAFMTVAATVPAQNVPPPNTPPPAGLPQASAPMSQDFLDGLLAPIALYPDQLLAQVLMASTYPLEVVQAARFVKANPTLRGAALDDALKDMPWDPSVLSLASFPQVLDMMNDKLDWTQRLGDAFLADEAAVMQTVQGLRARAQQAGNLQSTEQQQVIVQERTIIIQPAQPQYLFVPVYNPTVIFGPWWAPAYQPWYWFPPPIWGFGPRPPNWGFYSGFFWGTAWGISRNNWGWAQPNWRGNNINININNNNVWVNRPGVSRPRFEQRQLESQRGSSPWRRLPRQRHRQSLSTDQQCRRAVARELPRPRQRDAAVQRNRGPPRHGRGRQHHPTLSRSRWPPRHERGQQPDAAVAGRVAETPGRCATAQCVRRPAQAAAQRVPRRL